jgi:hypothetical protein
LAGGDERRGVERYLRVRLRDQGSQGDAIRSEDESAHFDIHGDIHGLNAGTVGWKFEWEIMSQAERQLDNPSILAYQMPSIS